MVIMIAARILKIRKLEIRNSKQTRN